MTPNYMGFLIILGFVLCPAVMAWFLVILGVRRTDQPICRACEHPLRALPSNATRCPKCNHDLKARGGVRWIGRRRPLVLWIIGFVMSLPALGLVVLFAITVAGRSWLEEREARALLAGGGTGPISLREARILDTDQLLQVMARRPGDQWGWNTVRDRFRDVEPNREQCLGLIAALESDARLNNTMITPNTVWAMDVAFNTLGYNHPTVQTYMANQLSTPDTCPTVSFNRGRLNFVRPEDQTASKNSPLNLGRNSVLPTTVITGIRIDGLDIPRQDSSGRWIWGRYNRRTNNIRADDLPKAATTPGEHTIEFDVVRAVLPIGVGPTLPFTHWPDQVVTSEGTVSCTYAVPEEQAAD